MGGVLSCQSPLFPILALIGSIVAIGIFSANISYFKRVAECQNEKPISTCPGSPITGSEASSMVLISWIALAFAVVFAIMFLWQTFVSRRLRQAIGEAVTKPGAIELGYGSPETFFSPETQARIGLAAAGTPQFAPIPQFAPPPAQFVAAPQPLAPRLVRANPI